MLEDYCVIDLEMTGLNPKHHKILEVAAVRVRKKEIVSECSMLIRQHQPLEEKITELTGIDQEMLAGAKDNAMMRPLNQMVDQGVTFDRIPCSQQGELQLNAIEPLLKPNTKAIMMLHASNVCGTLMPLEQVGEICQKHGLTFVVDAAQTAGSFPIDMKKQHIDVLAFTGHKSLLGPQGIGGFLVSDEVASQMIPLVTGGMFLEP